MTYSAETIRVGRAAALWGVVLLLTVSCSDSPTVTGPQTPGSGAVRAAPAIESFTADPAEITEGQESELTWVVDDPDAAVRITPLSGSIEGTSVAVRPVVTTTYTLTATNPFGSSRGSVNVTVNPAGSASPGTASAGSTDASDPTGATADPTDETGDDLFAPTWVNAAANLEGLESECGNLSSIASNPYEDMVIAGVALQGLWASRNGSEQWEPLGQGPGSDPIINRLTSIVYDPADPNVFWESGSYGGGGIYKTVDNGLTFTLLGDTFHSDLVAIDFNDPLRQTLLTGRHEEGLLFRSTDGGATWSDITVGLPSNIGFATSPYVIDSQTYLLGTQDGSDSGVFRTANGGLTWETVFNEGIKGAPVVTPSDGAFYWLLKTGEGMITSTDGGLTWTRVAGAGPRSIFSSSLVMLPDERLVVVSGSNLAVTADKGNTWKRIGPRFPYEPFGFTYAPFRNAFYAFRYDCSFEDPSINVIRDDAIIRLDGLDAQQ